MNVQDEALTLLNSPLKTEKTAGNDSLGAENSDEERGRMTNKLKTNETKLEQSCNRNGYMCILLSVLALTSLFAFREEVKDLEIKIRNSFINRYQLLPRDQADCRFSPEGSCHPDRIKHRDTILSHLDKHEMWSTIKRGAPHPVSDAFRANTPFPHVAIDGLFPEKVLDKIAPLDGTGEFPEDWVGEFYNGGDKLTADMQRKFFDYTANRGWRCIGCETRSTSNERGYLKIQNFKEPIMGPYTQGLVAALKSQEFIEFLEQLSGISPLYADENNFGSGLHQITRDGALQIHADFRLHPWTGMERRVNAFLFFNRDWDEEWGGHQELWDRNVTRCHARIAPLFNRFIIFTPHDFSYHGHPEPLNVPGHRSRRSLAMYYYSPIPRPQDTIDYRHEAMHSTLYVPAKCTHCSENICRAEDENKYFLNY